jgi:hypothetical protein
MEDFSAYMQHERRIVDVGHRGGHGDAEHDPRTSNLVALAGTPEQAHSPFGHRGENARQAEGRQQTQ